MNQEFEQLIGQMQHEINEVDLKATGTMLRKGIAAVPQALKAAYNKMKVIIKTIEPAWFQFGSAIARLKNNKFGLFSKKGNNLSGELDDIKRVKFDKKSVPFYQYKGKKHSKTEGWLQPDGRVAFAKMTHEGVPLVYMGPSVFDTSLIKVEEAIISDAQRIVLQETCLKEQEMEPREQEAQYAAARKQADVEFDFQDYVSNVVKEEPREMASSYITYDGLFEILEDMASVVEAGAGRERKMSLILYGPPGVGKSEIPVRWFKGRGYKICVLQIKNIPIESTAGFPVIIDLKGKMAGEKGVKMTVADYLPPSGSKDKWLLFLDEFNAGGDDKQKAAMEFALSGKIVSYTLPPDTAVVACGNAGEKDKATAVSELDAPSFGRFARKVYMKPDLPGWLKYYALKDRILEYEGAKINTGPVLSIITRNLTKWSEKEHDPEAAFRRVMMGFHDEAEEVGWLSGRTWATLDAQMKFRGMREYKTLTNEQKAALVEYGKKHFKNMKAKTEKEQFAIGSRAYTIGKQDEILKRIGPTTLGANSEELVSEMLLNYAEYKKEKVSSLDILLNYKGVRERAKKSRTIDAEVLLNEIADEIVNFGSATAMKKYMKDKGIRYYKETTNDPLAQALLNIEQFVQDLDVGAEILTAHFEALAPALELKNQLVIDWKAGLLQLGNDRIKAGWSGFLQSVDKQFKDLATGSDKTKFMELRKAGKSYTPIIQASKRIKDSELRLQFIDTETKNFILHFSRARKKERKEEEIIVKDEHLLKEMLELAGVE